MNINQPAKANKPHSWERQLENIKAKTNAKEQIDPFTQNLERLAFNDILDRIDDMFNTSNMNTKESEICQLMMKEIEAQTLTQAFSSFQGIQKEVALMILQQVLPDLSSDLRKISKLKLTTTQILRADPCIIFLN